jgi:group II intron reverse transcriptase/maturase
MAAQRDKKLKFTALLHHVTVDLLYDSFKSLKRNAASGVDGVTWRMYKVNLDANISRLHDRIQRGCYRALPSRRVYIPKPDGRRRPLGVAALEDKLVQSAVVKVLNCIYETDFKGFSYGFRPERSQHQALDALYVGITRKPVNYVLDADIRGFFDNINHEWMLKFLGHRIADKRVLRLIARWLRAGVLEGGMKYKTKLGTPQGSGISPLLANIYLHYALDLWVEFWRKRYGKGEVIFVRYCDDFVLGFQYRSDATLFMADLHTRMKKFGLTMHPDKTKLILFGTWAITKCQQRGWGKPRTFDFLGFTHICCNTWKNKKFFIRRMSIRKRFAVKLREIRNELWDRRHAPISEQGKWLRSVVQGYMNYHAVPYNGMRIRQFLKQVRVHWIRALRRRSQTHNLSWKKFAPVADYYLPRLRIIHPYPNVRFDARYSR